MPDKSPLSKSQIWGLSMLQRFFDAVRKERLREMLESDELRRFLDQARRGTFGDEVPDVTPGSKIPGTGAQDPLDVLDGLFHGVGARLGEIDRSGGVDPAAMEPDGVTIGPNGTRQTIHTNPDTGDRVTIRTHTNGEIDVWTAHRDGSADGFTWKPDGSTGTVHVDHTPGGSPDFGAGIDQDSVEVDMYRGANGRDVVTVTVTTRDGHKEITGRSVWRPGSAPGEGDGEANTGRNPLGGLEVVGPLSLGRMTDALRSADSRSEMLDPNTGKGGLKLTDADKERLGRIVPRAEALDPNSGVDPLSLFNLDPTRFRTRTEDDDRVDPNTGRKPMPGGG